MISIKTNNPLADYSNYPLYHDNHVNYNLVDQLESLFKRPIRFLDIGCAGGNLALEFHRRGHLAVGIDGSDQCLNPRQDIVQQRGGLPAGYENWQNYYGKILFTCDLTKPYEIQENGKLLKFDVIGTWDVLEYIHPDSIDFTLEILSNHLEDGGIFLGNVALFSSLGIGSNSEVEYHQSVFSKEWWIEKLQKYFCFINYPILEHNRSSHAHLVFSSVKYLQKKLKKTVISHFYNEEYLLPWWLMHHREIFDHGIMIDYDSTDKSIEIIKEYCPTWTIVKTRNKTFNVVDIDSEVMDYEAYIDGFKIALNSTEFLVGDLSFLDKPNAPAAIFINPFVMVDPPEQVEKIATYDKSLLEQKHHGLSFKESVFRFARILHRIPTKYPPGRHYEPTDPLFPIHDERVAILWYGYSPYVESLIKRKRQICSKLDPNDDGSLHKHRISEDGEKIDYIEVSSRAIDLKSFLSQNFKVKFDS